MIFVGGLLISTVTAVDLVNDDFKNEYFEIDTPAGSNFSQGANTAFNIGDVAWNIAFFHNLGNNSKDVSTVLYLKDSSDNKDTISSFTNDVAKEGKVIEENENYTVIKNQEYDSWDFLGNDSSISLENIANSIKGLFSSDEGSNDSANNNSIDGYLAANVHDDDYIVYLKNPDDGQIIVIAGDNLELVKKMADSASFKK